MKILNNEDIIAHFGILGQKWGIRRYQNEDGTLTEAGKARYYGDDGDKYTTKVKNSKGETAYKINSKGYTQADKIMGKLDKYGTYMSPYRSWYDKYADYYANNSVFSNRMIKEYYKVADRALKKHEKEMNWKTVSELRNSIAQGKRKFIKQDCKGRLLMWYIQ